MVDRSEVEAALHLIEVDDRRKLRGEELEETKALWVDAFQAEPPGALTKAVRAWLEGNPAGRPNIGKLKALLLPPPDRSSPTPTTPSEARALAERRFEVAWAVSILEDASRYEKYPGTLLYAERTLRQHLFRTWEEAKAWLQPGWSPPQVTEVYL